MTGKEYKLLLIGPLPPPITGVSLANKVIIENLKNVKIEAINTSYHTLEENIGKFTLNKTIFYTKQYKELYKIFNADKVYITPGQTFFGIIKYAPYIMLAKLLKKELIIHIHGDYLWQEYNKLRGVKKSLFSNLVSMFDKGIVLSKTLRRNLEPFLPKERIFELSNFVEDYLFDIDINKKIETNFKTLKIIYLSNLMKEKGILDLLEALLILKRNNFKFEAKIAGRISSEIERKVKDLLQKLEPEVEYLGVVLGNEKKNLLKWGNIFVFPTYYRMEGQPISILEAYATGNIVLTTKQGGIPDIFKDKENGFYIEKTNPNDIVNKLLYLGRNLEKYKYIAFNNHLEANRKYTVKSFIQNFTKILKSQKGE